MPNPLSPGIRNNTDKIDPQAALYCALTDADLPSPMGYPRDEAFGHAAKSVAEVMRKANRSVDLIGEQQRFDLIRALETVTTMDNGLNSLRAAHCVATGRSLDSDIDKFPWPSKGLDMYRDRASALRLGHRVRADMLGLRLSIGGEGDFNPEEARAVLERSPNLEMVRQAYDQSRNEGNPTLPTPTLEQSFDSAPYPDRIDREMDLALLKKDSAAITTWKMHRFGYNECLDWAQKQGVDELRTVGTAFKAVTHDKVLETLEKNMTPEEARVITTFLDGNNGDAAVTALNMRHFSYDDFLEWAHEKGRDELLAVGNGLKAITDDKVIKTLERNMTPEEAKIIATYLDGNVGEAIGLRYDMQEDRKQPGALGQRIISVMDVIDPLPAKKKLKED